MAAREVRGRLPVLTKVRKQQINYDLCRDVVNAVFAHLQSDEGSGVVEMSKITSISVNTIKGWQKRLKEDSNSIIE